MYFTKPLLNFTLILVVSTLSVNVIHAATAPMKPSDLVALPSVSNPLMSPAGKSVYFQLSQVDWQENKRISQIWRQNLADGKRRQLTYSTDSAASPVLSPDGAILAFVSERNKDKNNQIYFMYTDGGEAFKPVEIDQSPRNILWSKESNSLYFRATMPRSKNWKTQIKKREIIPTYEDPEKKYQIWQLDIKQQTVSQITTNDYSVVNYSVGPKNQFMLFSKANGSRIDQRHGADLWMMKIDGTEKQRLTNNEFYERDPQFSPDAQHILFSATVNENFEDYYSNNLFLLNPGNKEIRLLTKDFSGDIEEHAWSKEGNYIYFTANVGLSTHLFSYHLASNQITQETTGEFTVKEWVYQQGPDSHLLKIESATSPAEIWRYSRQAGQLEKITNIHTDIGTRFKLPVQEKIQWKTKDGQSLEGLLTYPLEYKKGTAFPLVVQTHGGPRSSDQYGIWSSTDYVPVLADLGYGVLMVNHRGGVGYGDAFLRDMVGQYFRHAHLDVLSGVDHLIERGLADPDKLVKMGWSAGGHMTNKVITFTDRFKAASSGAGTVDWIAHYGETDTNYKRTWWFGGKPWEQNAPIANYLNDSVVKDLWKVKTPTLIFVGEEDVRVPSSQSKILFRGLRDLGVETELYVAPGEPHGFRKPTHRLFKINKEIEWFERHVHDREYAHDTPPKEKQS